MLKAKVLSFDPDGKNTLVRLSLNHLGGFDKIVTVRFESKLYLMARDIMVFHKDTVISDKCTLQKEDIFIYCNDTPGDTLGNLRATALGAYNEFLSDKLPRDEIRIIANKAVAKLVKASEEMGFETLKFLNSITMIYKGYNSRLIELDESVEGLISSIKCVLARWWKHYIVRPLILLDVYKRDKYNSFMMDPLTLYHYAITDPFSIGELELYDMLRIYKLVMRSVPVKLYTDRGKLARYLTNSNQNGDSYAIVSKKPTKMLLGNTMTCKVVGEEIRVYQSKYIEAEEAVTNWLLNLASTEFQINVEKLTELAGNLTPEQLAGVSNCLSHSLSILTGGPGTGKCVAPDTLVRMYDGTLKRASLIAEGDRLMSPVGPTVVLSTTVGTSTMYKVTSGDKSLICNDEHLLTLYDTRSKSIMDIRVTDLLNPSCYRAIFEHKGIIIGNCIQVTELPVGEYCGFTLVPHKHFIIGNGMVTHNTECLDVMTSYLGTEGVPYRVLTPTGMSAKVVTARTGVMASTIQSYSSVVRKSIKTVIVDESSMLNTTTLNMIRCSIPNIERLILVGDINQLPPIGAGDFFKALVNKKSVPKSSLTKNFRVREGSCLVQKSKDLLKGEELTEGKGFSLREGGIDCVKSAIEKLIKRGIPKGSIMVMCVYRKDVESINRYCSIKYGEKLKTDTQRFKVGDHVIYTMNNKTSGIMNGDQGTVTRTAGSSVVVNFGEIDCVLYDDTLDLSLAPLLEDHSVLPLRYLQLAYSITVAKAQGSGYEYTIVYLGDIENDFITLNLVYTAMTRAKTYCKIIGQSIKQLSNLKVKKNNTEIHDRLK